MQKAHHPGQGHHFQETGECAGAWIDHSNRTCTHADMADSTAVLDVVEVFESAYLAELASGEAYCKGDTPGNRFRVLYVTTKDRSNRYATLLTKLREKSELADYYLWKSAKQTGGSRHLRFACTAAGNIDIANVTLPNSADDSWEQTKAALRTEGYNNGNRKYIAFLDWRECCDANGNRTDVGGRSEIKDNDMKGQDNPNNDGNRISGVYLPAAKDGEASVMLHEAAHNLGGVQKSAPRHDGQNTYHPRDERDRLAYGGNTYVAEACENSTLEFRLDCNDNDYFNTSPPNGSYLDGHWNAARNRFLVGGG